MVRFACCLATERGVKVVVPVHDALMIEDPADAIEVVVARTQEAMAEVSAIVLDGFRVRADGLSLASNAMASLRELVSGPDVPPSVRLRASLAILDAANALKAEELGPTSAEGVQAKMEHQRFIDSLGG
jgi:hypothetical protein